ncbi:hypothetical protein [Sphingomonas sp.]|uniref:hypothetical protein n=1 Tax=Sphingomonas sp. TaxID=28214 RepID=UPI0025FB7F3C|nr:hypothetical protein [Sphingomonas sp.]MBV9528029.1 hypothetical protein [Sphingomonas sp.]
MGKLSISRAWDEARAVLARDGRLLVTVALALLVLPAIIVGAAIPGGIGAAMFMALQGQSVPMFALLFVVLVIMLVGQLAVTRLAIGPSVSVGGAIAHAVRRLLVYIGVGLLVGAAIMLALIAGAIIIGLASGPSVTQQQLETSPAVAIAVLVMVLVYLFLLTRIISMAAAVTSAEHLGVIGTLRRCWSLTRGHFWRLFGFLVTFFIGTGILLFAISSVVGLAAELLFGKLEPMAASTLVVGLVDGVASGAVTLLLWVMLAGIYVQLTSVAAQPTVPNSGI